MQEVQIIPACEEYIEACAEISCRVYEKIHEIYIEQVGEELHDEFYPDWRQSKMNGVRTGLREGIKTGRAFMALLDGRPVGFVSYHVDGMGHGEIGNNAVDNFCRGHGIGPKLYEACFAAMRAEGIEYACVVTGGDDGHAPARRAYEKAGFQKYLPSVRYLKKL